LKNCIAESGDLEATGYQEKTQGKKVKGKAIPLQALTGPDGSRRLRLSDL
jgi:hypothetical protein